MLVKILFGLFVLIAIPLFSLSQIVVPLWNGKPVFPLFRRRGDLGHKLVLAHGELEEAHIEKKIAEVKSLADRVREEYTPTKEG